MPDRDTLVEGLFLAIVAFGLLLLGTAGYVAARVVSRAEAGDRRRYVLAGMTVFAPPLFFAGLARSLAWLYGRSNGSMISPDAELWLFFGNLLPAMACSASAAFVLPFRGTRERGFAIVGGAATAFAVYCFSFWP